jgi:hypothetical protein
MSTPPSLAALTVDDFETRVDDTFLLPAGPQALAFKLVEVRRLGQATREGGAFSLLFTTPPGPFLRQGIYPLDNPTLGQLDLFIVPLGPRDGGNGYEVVFT